MATRTGVSLSDDIVAIFVLDISTTPPRAVSFAGTGFMVFPHLLLTCWHCVSEQLPANQAYVALSVLNGEVRVDARFRLTNIERDRHGADLATAEVDISPRAGFQLTDNPGLPGTEVFTFGYPLTEKVRFQTGELNFIISPRYLGGHITRTLGYVRPQYGLTHSYELSFMAPSGLSGAPLIARRTRDIIGVVYGNSDSYLITEEATINPETGESRPEVRRIVSFGLALHTQVVSAVATRSTSEAPLLEFVRRRPA